MAKSASATDIFSHGDADEPLLHGGDLSAAQRQFPDAPEPFIDLSTGINPNSYPVPPLGSELFARLPESEAVAGLAAAAAAYYSAPSAAHVVPAPGTQILLPLVAGLVRPGRAVILSPTYNEHARCAALAGHRVTETLDTAALGEADLAIVTNPNSPDGRLLDRDTLLGIAAKLRLRSGLLVVDEAFMDVLPPSASVASEAVRNIVVLRSFGKFFGLAGVRLGFALLDPQLAARLSASLGPWAVSGPALAIGAAALADGPWIERTRHGLKEATSRLDALFGRVGLEVIGGIALFRLVRAQAATALFHHLGHDGILVRRFPDNPAWLRFGLPGNEAAWTRLENSLSRFRGSEKV
jgi:cobalamin biosynthetic protein CobC